MGKDMGERRDNNSFGEVGGGGWGENIRFTRDIWFVSSTGQTCPEGRSTNRTRGPMRGAPPYPIQTRKTRPQHRELHALLFTTSVRVLLRPTGL